ncbi:MAG: radical SAM protein [Deltaproteobacteria bacterium]|jgi:uncharacterized protein|nr:radical SAM protein [Deltaproteobacteria bacterium]
MLTSRCDLGCRYCYLGDAEQMDIEEALLTRAISELGPGQGPLYVQLSGGEPTLRPDLIRLASKLLKKLHRPVSLAVQTNATLIDSAMAKELKSLDIQVGVSLDGPPEINEPQRGKTREALRGLAFLENAGVPFRATAVVTALNARRLYETALVLSGYSLCRGLGLDLLVKAGRARASSEKAPLEDGAKDEGLKAVCRADPYELEAGAERLGETIISLGKLRRSPLSLRELELVRRAFQNGPPRHFCHAARGAGLAVRPGGALFPCGQLSSSPLAKIGDLREGAYLPGRAFTSGSILKGFDEAASEKLDHEGGPSLARPSSASAMSRECPTCPLKGRCPGECPSRLRLNNEEKPLACRLYRGLARAGGLIAKEA